MGVKSKPAARARQAVAKAEAVDTWSNDTEVMQRFMGLLVEYNGHDALDVLDAHDAHEHRNTLACFNHEDPDWCCDEDCGENTLPEEFPCSTLRPLIENIPEAVRESLPPFPADVTFEKFWPDPFVTVRAAHPIRLLITDTGQIAEFGPGDTITLAHSAAYGIRSRLVTSSRERVEKMETGR